MSLTHGVRDCSESASRMPWHTNTASDVLSRKFSEHRWSETKPLLTELVGDHAEFVRVWFSWRPASPDPGDDYVIDCAMNARAMVVTSNERDFREAVRNLGLKVMTPVKFLEHLTNRGC